MISLFIFISCLIGSLQFVHSFRIGRVDSTRPKNLLFSTSEGVSKEDIIQGTSAKSVVVIKYGGHAMENEEFKELFCKDIAFLCEVYLLMFLFTNSYLMRSYQYCCLDWNFTCDCTRGRTSNCINAENIEY